MQASEEPRPAAGRGGRVHGLASRSGEAHPPEDHRMSRQDRRDAADISRLQDIAAARAVDRKRGLPYDSGLSSRRAPSRSAKEGRHDGGYEKDRRETRRRVREENKRKGQISPEYNTPGRFRPGVLCPAVIRADNKTVCD